MRVCVSDWPPGTSVSARPTCVSSLSAVLRLWKWSWKSLWHSCQCRCFRHPRHVRPVERSPPIPRWLHIVLRTYRNVTTLLYTLKKCTSGDVGSDCWVFMDRLSPCHRRKSWPWMARRLEAIRTCRHRLGSIVHHDDASACFKSQSRSSAERIVHWGYV